MKIKRLLVYILIAFCFVSVKNVYADTKTCVAKNYFSKEEAEKRITSVKLHDQSKTKYAVGEKVYLDITGIPKDKTVEMAITFYNVRDGLPSQTYTTWIKNLDGVSDNGLAYFIVPDFLQPGEVYVIWHYTYFEKTDIVDYYYMVDGEQIPYYKDLCANYMPKKSDAEVWDGFFIDNSSSTITIIQKEEEKKDILKEVSLNDTTAYFGGKYTVNVKTSEPISRVRLEFCNSEINRCIYGYMFYASDATSYTAEIDVPPFGANNIDARSYKLHTVYLYDANNNVTKYITVDVYAKFDPELLYFNSDLTLKLEEPQSNMIGEGAFEITNLNIENNTATIGERVTVRKEFLYDSASKDTKSVLLTFYNEQDNTMFSTYLKSLLHDSYIVVPSTAKEGTYKLKSAVITLETFSGETKQIAVDENGIYKDIFNQVLTIKKADNINQETSVLYFSAVDLNDDVYQIIEESNDGSIITINAGSDSVIPAKVFDLVKESTKQLIIESNGNEWVFNGTDIVDIKPVNVNMKLSELVETDLSEEIKKSFGSDAMAITFPNNGQLPGKALIRIKDNTLYNRMTKDKFYIYYVDKNGNKLNRVATEVQKSYNGYVEFYINHNSTYIISNKELTDTKVLGQDEEIMKVNSPNAAAITVDEKSDSLFLIGIVCACALVLIIIVLLFVSSKKKKKKLEEIDKKIEEVKEEKQVETNEPVSADIPVVNSNVSKETQTDTTTTVSTTTEPENKE